jgi:polyisoprenoid-binding protein YceI
MRRKVLGSAVLTAILVAPSLTHAAKWNLDEDHTSVSFRIRHLFTSVEGRFDEFSGEISFDPADPTTASVSGEIEAASIDTNVAERDKHLRSDDFFDVEKYPKITFKSTKVTDVSADKKSGKLHGKLTIRGVEKDVVLDARFLGAGKDTYDNVKAGFSGTVTIDRKDFGLKWNDTLETGGLLVGDEVEIRIDAAVYAAD